MEENVNEESARFRRARSFRERPDRGGESLRRVRSFKTTSKGLVNRGDSFKVNQDQEGAGVSSLKGYEDVDSVISNNSYQIPKLITTGSECEHRFFRVLIVGGEGVGKSSIIDQFMTSEFLGSGNFNVYPRQKLCRSRLLEEEHFRHVTDEDSDKSEHAFEYDILSEGHSYITRQRPRSYSLHASRFTTHENNVKDKGIRHRRMSLPANEARIRKDRASVEIPTDYKGRRNSTMEDAKQDDRLRNRRAKSFKERSYKDGENLRRVRSFKTTSKGLVNRGDSYEKKKESGSDYVSAPKRENITYTLQTSDTSVGPRLPTTKGGDGQRHFRVLLAGGAGVGKSSIIDQFMTSEFLGCGSFNISQSEGDRTVTLQVDGEESTLEFVQSEDFQDQDESFQIDAFVVVYCITERETFDIAIDLLKQIREEVGSNKAIILVGNKSDLVRKRTISQEEGRSAADSFGCKYIELSAALNHRVDELLVGIHKQISLKSDADIDELESKVSKAKERKSSFKRTKRFLEKVFLGHSGKDKKTENLYVD